MNEKIEFELVKVTPKLMKEKNLSFGEEGEGDLETLAELWDSHRDGIYISKEDINTDTYVNQVFFKVPKDAPIYKLLNFFCDSFDSFQRYCPTHTEEIYYYKYKDDYFLWYTYD